MNEQYARSHQHLGRYLKYQALLVAVLMALLIFWPASGFYLGGLVCAIPSLCCTSRLFVSRAQGSRRIVSSIYQAEMIKWAISAAMFFMVFVFIDPLKPKYFFGGFIVVQALQCLMPLLLGNGQCKNRVVDHSSI